MKGQNGIQTQVHPQFLLLMHEWQDKRIAMGKDSKTGKEQLSIKRLSLTLSKYFRTNPMAYDTILNAEINKHDE